ncbi:hypothetical protein PVAND_017171 [Polypedilum vanderplanki]|uniref:Fibronectin type-III domain-containing protein n=1 Tax=Polypedilum vanderplanki TaxID=319348 RepID=A0A9J6BHB9_POLVA|nr:hypothetical protein PVAND_017171 [Polypedilum vanderplanki]
MKFTIEIFLIILLFFVIKISSQQIEENEFSKPRDIVIDASSSTSLSVCWKTPLKNYCNGKISTYRIGILRIPVENAFTFQTIEHNDEIEEQNFEFKFLKPNTEYAVLIQAFNGKCEGLFSDVVVQRTAENLTSLNSPPSQPKLTILKITENSITFKIEKNEDETAPVQGFILHYRKEFDDWETKNISINEAQNYTIENLQNGLKVDIYAIAYNSIGQSNSSEVLPIKTLVEKIKIPEKSQFIAEISSHSVTLELSAWKDDQIVIKSLAIINRKKNETKWDYITSNAKPRGRFVILDLKPSTTYIMNVTAESTGGDLFAEYEYTTLSRK